MLIKNTFIVSLCTFISRILGFARDAIIAHVFGASVYNDIFLSAWRLPNLFRSFFGEGALHASLIPTFEKIKTKNGEEEALLFASHIKALLLLILVLLCIVLLVFTGPIMGLLIPGISDPAMNKIAITTSRITSVYILLISVVTFYGGILNVYNRFFVFATAPIFLNISIIVISAIFKFKPTIYQLSASCTFGGMVELAWMLYFARRYKLFFTPKLKFTKHVKEFATRLVPGILGSSINLINLWINTAIASFIPGVISCLYFAERLQQLPLALISTAVGTVLLPKLSKFVHRQDYDNMFKLQNNVMLFITVVAIPCTIYFMVFSIEIIDLLFGHGKFDETAINITSSILKILSFGYLIFMMHKMLVVNFHSHGDTKYPAKVAMISLVINVTTSISLIPYLEHLALPIGSVLAAFISVIILVRTSRNRNMLSICTTHLKKTIFSLCIGVLSYLATGFMYKYVLTGLDAFYVLTLGGIVTLAIYVPLLFLFRIISLGTIREMNL